MDGSWNGMEKKLSTDLGFSLNRGKIRKNVIFDHFEGRLSHWQKNWLEPKHKPPRQAKLFQIVGTLGMKRGRDTKEERECVKK